MRRTVSLFASVFTFATTMSAPALAETKLDSDKSQFSYAIGYQIGQQLKSDGLDVDAEALGSAIADVLSGGEPQISMEQMQAAVNKYQQSRMAQQKQVADRNLKAGEDFLAKNKSKDGVVALDNGIQYKVINEGSGEKPSAEDTVTVHYRGTLIDGVEFDSSYSRGEPATFPVGGVIKGWQEILPMMKEGAKWEVYIPAALAYGERGAGASIGPNETLIFEIELLSIKG